jgi:formylglycine-generating enzyme required for sulfatase activity
LPSAPAASARAAIALLAIASALCGVEPGMVFIPAGEFSRGRTYEWPDTELKWYPNPLKDDLPVRRITVDPFYLDQAEVTNERYAQFLKASRRAAPYHWIKGQVPNGKEAHPVVNVSWEDASVFCQTAGKRLPTEAEWERACRGIAEGRMYPWGDTAPTAGDAHFDAEGTAAVCQKTKNYFGLCDAIGNVWEWVADWYARDYYKVAPATNPRGPSEGLYRVIRGGSWFDQPPLFLTCSYRSWARQTERSPTIGFRCAKSFSPRRGVSLNFPR